MGEEVGALVVSTVMENEKNQKDEQGTPQSAKDDLTDAELEQASGGFLGKLTRSVATKATPMDPLINTAGGKSD
jgi:hypothetical protein